VLSPLDQKLIVDEAKKMAKQWVLAYAKQRNAQEAGHSERNQSNKLRRDATNRFADFLKDVV
jgi:hypothetical protein